MKKKILMIGTGGTIASDKTEYGLAPELNTEDLLKFIPEAVEICEVDCIQAYSLDSTNMRPSHWLGIAKIIKERYGDYDGFVICHGTDTMAYTAAALSYLIRNSKKPIVLTGSQKPIWFDGTDSKRNLTDALIYATRGASGVYIVFNGRVILGTRARKSYSKSFQAFSSVNYPYVAHIQDGKILQYITPVPDGETKFSDRLNENVGLLKLAPGISCEIVKFMLDRHDGLIIESFGVGGIPEYSDFYGIIRAAQESGKIIVITTQVPNEGSDLAIYNVGNRLKSTLPILECYDMTTESAYAKLMWIMGKTSDFGEIQRLFYTPVSNDLLKGSEK